ncbi:RNA-guided endonuclease IscB [Streptomyces sp. H27-H1]|uniref:RNA-guided endonuclease IscB n=1 Tax=Streptomyces sp. H27-H1 TaxID=2996461 RepID=UPI0022713B1A|nr:RNA-guided endonuclease IscB [Streptomyces sp. H27-H1]MCY0927349.1 RNA-guided endonuclease IscB [Streptomyces sp. H27-H1]
MTTFPAGEKTHRAVLPQRPALESVGADTPGSRDETAHGVPAARRGTGRGHERGETDEARTKPRRRHAVPAAEATGTAEHGSGDVPFAASRVFVLAKGGEPLMPCHPARARELLDGGRAVVARRAPFVIRLTRRTLADSEVDGVEVRIDPGSKRTGIAVSEDRVHIRRNGAAASVRRGLVAVELRHRGAQIRDGLRRRAGYRRRRRSGNLRYRAPRNRNRTRPDGWLPPSLLHRVESTLSLVRRLCRYAPVTAIHVELVAFDTCAIAGADYRDGTRAGAEIRAYLRTKWERACAYCGVSGVPLNIEHIRPRSHGGSGRTSNLALACVPCNVAKGTLRVEVFLAHRPARLRQLMAQAQTDLHDAAAMNATRNRLVEALTTLQRPVSTWSGALTHWNRTAMGLPKSHTLDALVTGHLDHLGGAAVVRVPQQVLVVTATGRGSYARTTPDRYGFPRLLRPRKKQHYGFATGDLVRADLSRGKWRGRWVGRIAVRASGQHRLTTATCRFDVSHRNVRLLQRGDGYTYGISPEIIG